MTSAKEREWHLHNLDDISFAIRLSRGDGFPQGWADFEVYQIVGWPHEPKPGEPERFYARRSAESDVDMVERIEDAELFAEGFVKWDGCCEFRLKDTHHMCGRGNGEDFGKMIVAIWDLASKLLESWDHECAGTVKL